MSYKRDIEDVRESPALDVIHLLRKRGAAVSFSDPYVPSIVIDSTELQASPLNASLAKADCAVIITDHSKVNYEAVVRKSKLIIDTRNALKGFSSDRIIRL